MLKSIETARSECTAKNENKASYNTEYIEKRSKRRLKKELFKIVILYRLKICLLLVISENFLSTIRKNKVLAICISY